MDIIYHLVHRDSWTEAQGAERYEAPSLAAEGFIHCSVDEDQLLRVAQRLYPGVAGLQVLDVDTARLIAPVKREPSRSGEIYPHIYGPIDLDSVVRVRDLLLGPNGQHTLS